jgi:TfoX/Sxy family transcriptional regulator of competence genes
MGNGTWRKAPSDLVERFHEAVAGLEGIEVRQMFGYPAAFIGGNMTAGLHQESFLVRLSEAERTERLAAGWSTFEPMPGRPMREYLALPPKVVEDPEETRRWVERAAAYVRTLPPKVPKAQRSRGRRTT